ncbi:MAG TPA: sigma-70 family RNA polymerase sigma factor [Phnomibacter sp.]|nr:sigma-70 family RNA polymerase sigma factor [Phnomibacter sp.]
MIAALKKGDTDAFRDCFFCYHTKLLSFYRKKSVPEQDALDLVQSVFLKLWQNHETLNEQYNIEQHIFQIARTQYIDWLRIQNKRQFQVSEQLAELASPATQDPSLEYDMRQKLQLALDKMPDMRKRVFELHRLKGYSYGEIASIYSISVKSVDNHVAKAVRQLRQAFGSIIAISLLFL